MSVAPVAEAAVSIVSRDRVLAAGTTDENGYFEFTMLAEVVDGFVTSDGVAAMLQRRIDRIERALNRGDTGKVEDRSPA